MKIKEIIRILHSYQKWRRGANIQQPDPKEVGRAIDGAVRELQNFQHVKIRIERKQENVYSKC